MKNQSVKNTLHNVGTLATVGVLVLSLVALVVLAFVNVNILDMMMLNDFGMLVEVFSAQPVLTGVSMGAFVVSGVTLTWLLGSSR